MSVEFATNSYNTLSTYLEDNIVTYTCEYNSTITDVVSCNAAGNWETPTLECPACMYYTYILNYLILKILSVLYMHIVMYI